MKIFSWFKNLVFPPAEMAVDYSKMCSQCGRVVLSLRMINSPLMSMPRVCDDCYKSNFRECSKCGAVGWKEYFDKDGVCPFCRSYEDNSGMVMKR